MPREIKTPLTLWICAAVCVHYLFGEGGSIVARNHDDRSNLWALSWRARERVRQEEQTMEVALVSDGAELPAVQEPPEEPEKKPEEPKKKKDEPKVETPKPPPPKPKEEKKKLVLKPDDDKTKPPPPKDPLQDKRIAVKQHVKPDQEDNPTARFVGDEANHVDKETVATQTSHDRDDEKPTPGGNHAGPQEAAGDSERTKIAESEEHKGDKNRAPGEKGTEFDIQKMPKPSPQPQTAQETATKPQPSPKATPQGNGHPVNPNPTPPQPAPPAPATAQAQAPTPGTEPAPELQDSPNGTWSPGLFRPGFGGTPQPSNSSGISKANPTPGPTGMPQFGTGQRLFRQNDITAIVGQDNLRKMRESDGERRKSEHRGSWVASNFERWRSAIENYVSNVKPGNQTALNTAAVPFASYLNGMHNRIHPLFADSFLGSLDGLPKNHPLNDTRLITKLEIVLTRDGHLQKMGIVKTSGVTAFDIAALDAVNRAQPFGPAPKAIISPDGNVYLHWEFHRDEVYACSTMNARPYLLNVQPPNKQEPQPPPAAPTPPTKERELPPTNTRELREGALPLRPHQG